MNSAVWIAIYLPLFVLFVIILPQQYAININKNMISKHRKKGGFKLTNEIIKKYIGKNVRLSTGSYGINVEGTITEVNENWIEIKTKKGTELINSEYLQNIKIL